MRAVRSGRPARAASSASVSGPSASASKTPSSAAQKRCFAAMNPVAISKIRSGATVGALMGLLLCTAADSTYECCSREYHHWITADPKQRAWRLLVETYSAVFGRLSQELEAQTGLSMPWYDVLLHLDEAPA